MYFRGCYDVRATTGVTSVPAIVMATVTSGEIDASAGSSDVAPVPVLEPKLSPVGVRVPAVERSPPPVSEPPDPLPVVEGVPAIDLPSSPLSGRSSPVSSQLAWGDAGDSSVPLSPNRVQAGHSQNIILCVAGFARIFVSAIEG